MSTKMKRGLIAVKMACFYVSQSEKGVDSVNQWGTYVKHQQC